MKGNPMKISTLTALAVVLSLLAASAAQAGVPTWASIGTAAGWTTTAVEAA